MRIKFRNGLKMVLLFIVSVIILFPFYIMIVMGTYHTNDLFKGLRLLPGNYIMENLKTIIEADFPRYYLNSIYITVLATVGTLIVCTMAGYAFAKLKFRQKDRLFKACLATMMIPQNLGLFAFAWQVNKMGWINTHLPIIIPPMASMFGVFWMQQFIKGSVPNEILDSARIDGCGEFLMMPVIIVPLIKPALISLGLLYFLWNWNSYLVPMTVISKTELYTVPLGVQSLRQLYRIDYSAQILALAIGTLPIVVLFICFSKYFISGFISAAIKG